MQTMNIALPDALKDYVLQQTAQRGYSSVSEYVRELIRSDQTEKTREALELEVLRGLGSGKSESLTSEDWATMRREIQQRHATRNSS